MEWLGNNWIWFVFAVGIIAMHLFRHRGHGSGHNHGAKQPDTESGAVRGTVPSVLHSHGEIADVDPTDPQKTQTTELAAKPTIKHKHSC